MSETPALRIGLTGGLGEGSAADRNRALAKLRLADQLGYDCIWFGETWGADVVTVMADAVAATQRIKIGSGIMNVFSRSPGVIASTFATLDARSGGRMLIGLGSSGAAVIEHFHGVPFTKAMRRLREYVDIINMLIAGERLLYDGGLFHLDRGFRLHVDRVRDHIPVYIAAITPASIEQTGELADGIIPIHWPKQRYDSLRALLQRGADRSGRSAADVTIAPYLTVGYVLDEAQRTAVRLRARQPLAHYIGRMGVFYKDMLAREGYAEEVAGVEAAWGDDLGNANWEHAAGAVPDTMLDDIAVVGTPREIHDKLVELTQLGVDLPVLTMPPGDPDQAGAILEAIIKD